MATIITKNQAQDIIFDESNCGKKLKAKVLKYINADEGYMLKDGRVVLLRNDVYSIINFEEFSSLAYNHEAALLKDYSSNYILLNKDKNIDIFFNLFDKRRYDFSTESISYIDSNISKLEKKGYTEADLFLPIVTYLGEVLIRETNGKWSDVLIKGKPVVCVIGENGKVYDPYFCTREVLVNTRRPYAIHSAITRQLLLE